MKDTIKRQTMIIISIIGIVVVSLMMGLTYAYQSVVVTYSEGSDDDLSIKAGVLDVNFKATRRINETNLELMTDYTKAKYSQFTVTNNSSFLVSYYIGLTDLTCSPELASADFKYTLTKYNGNNIEFIYTGDFSGLDCSSGKYEFMLDGSKYRTLSIGESETLRLYLWLEETDENQNSLENTNFKGKLEITSVFEKDLIETVENPYAEGTLAYSIINNANNGNYGTKFRSKPLTVIGTITKEQSGPYVLVETEEEIAHQILGAPWNWTVIGGTSYSFDETAGITLNNFSNIDIYGQVFGEFKGKYLNFYDYSELFSGKTETKNLSGVIKYNEDGTKIKRYLAVSKGKSLESSLIKVDDSITDYYFRGEVEDNYLNFNGMCFRIVSILKDGSVKIVLADKNNECNDSAYSKYNATSSFVSYSSFASVNAYYDDSYTILNYELPTMNYISSINSWISDNFNTEHQSKIMDYVVNFGKLKKTYNRYEDDSTTYYEDDFKVTAKANLLTADDVKRGGSYLEYNAYSNWWRGNMAVPDWGCYNSLYSSCGTTDEIYLMAGSGIGAKTNNYADGVNDDAGNSAYIRPAMILKANLNITGSGTQNDPYVVM